MINKLILLVGFMLLTACAQVIASNDKQITIKAPPPAAAEAFQKAEEHCQRFNKNAVPSGTMYGNTKVFKCE